MWEWIASVAALAADNPGLALGIAFAAAIIEAVAVLGILIPGTPILMGVAGIAAMAGLPMLPILLVSVLGAVIGDGVSFWLGCRYNLHIRRLWPLSTRPGLMLSAERFFGRYGVMSVALCRFVPVLRSTVPLVAGMAGMATSRFFAANIFSAFIWAPVHVLPAQFAGMSVEKMKQGEWRTAALLAGVVLVIALAAFALHRYSPLNIPFVRRALDRLAPRNAASRPE